MQNDLEYSDDTKLLIEKDTREQMCERIGKYDISTETRELKIQWANVELLRREKHKLRKPLQPPFGQIKQEST